MSTWQARAISILVTLALPVAAGCGSDDGTSVSPPFTGEPGSTGAACYPNGTCNTGLDCRAGICESNSAPGEGADSRPSAGDHGSDAAPSSTPDPGTSKDPGGADTPASIDTAPASADTHTEPPSVFSGGMFQLTTHEVADACLDGALSLLFMPGGMDQPYDLQHPTEIPAWEDLPKTFVMKLQEPFSDMEVRLEVAGTNQMKVEDSSQADVVVDHRSYADCNVDMSIEADITVVDNDNLDLHATIKVRDWKSSGDTCPSYRAEPCTISLTMRGRRIN